MFASKATRFESWLCPVITCAHLENLLDTSRVVISKSGIVALHILWGSSMKINHFNLHKVSRVEPGCLNPFWLL